MTRNEIKIRQRLSSVNTMAGAISEYKNIFIKNPLPQVEINSRVNIARYEKEMANYAIDGALFGARTSEIKKALRP